MTRNQILIADDDPISLTMLRSVCERDGFAVTTAADGDQAYEILSKPDAPSLAVLDWLMPGMSGPDICRALRRPGDQRMLYLMLLTSKNHPDEIVEGLNAGADDFLAKPYHVEELRARIRAGMRLIALSEAQLERQRLQGVLEIAGAISHELNQPLQAIAGYTAVLKDDPHLDVEGKRIVAGLSEQARRVGRLTRRLMSITSYQTTDYDGAGTAIFDLRPEDATTNKDRSRP